MLKLGRYPPQKIQSSHLKLHCLCQYFVEVFKSYIFIFLFISLMGFHGLPYLIFCKFCVYIYKYYQKYFSDCFIFARLFAVSTFPTTHFVYVFHASSFAYALFTFLSGRVKVPREIEDNAYAKLFASFGVQETSKQSVLREM